MPPALVPTAVPPTQQQQHEPHYKNWVKTTKKKDTGSIYFIVKEDDNDEIAAFKALKEIDGNLKYKILALKLLMSHIYVGKQSAKSKRWNGHLTAESAPIDKFLLNHRLKGFKDVCINEVRKVVKKPLNVDLGFDFATQIKGFDSQEIWSALCGIFVSAVK